MYSSIYKSPSQFLPQTLSFISYLKNLKSCLLSKNFDNLEIEVSLAIENFAHEYDVEIVYVDEMKFTIHENFWYKMEPLTEEDINFYLPLLVMELKLYPKDFIKRIMLKKLILTNSILYHNDSYEDYRACIPDYEPDTNALVFSCKERNIKYIRNVIHHELFHYIYYRLNGYFENKDDVWEVFNPKGFYYGNKFTWNDSDLLFNDYAKQCSFVSDFSMASLDEDKAEIFSFLVTSGLDNVDLGKREGVIGKCLYIKKLMGEFDAYNFFTGKNDFWNKCIQFKKEVCDRYYF